MGFLSETFYRRRGGVTWEDAGRNQIPGFDPGCQGSTCICPSLAWLWGLSPALWNSSLASDGRLNP